MTPRTTRSTLRALHLIAAGLIGPFLYSPTLQSNAAYAATIQFVVLPAIALTGLWMWLAPRLGRRSSRTA